VLQCEVVTVGGEIWASKLACTEQPAHVIPLPTADYF